MRIDNIQQAQRVLLSYVPDVKKYEADGLSLNRMWPLLKAVGNPHEKLKVIHIAGTSGKTSTAYYTSALLISCGNKVGLTVSPHIDSITERVQINGEPISDYDFCSNLETFLDLISGVDEKPSYHELLIVFVLWVFVNNDVDYAVLETGLGGLLDSTNVVTRIDKLCVITDIGIDHANILGSDLGGIAKQKAGIIHMGNDVITYNQQEETLGPIRDRALEKNATIHLINQASLPQIATESQIALYQVRNFGLAYEAVSFLAARDGFNLDDDFDPLSVVIPGRMEVTQLDNGPTLILDGAHNAQKMHSFVDSFKKMYPGQKATVMLAMKEGKEYKEVIDILVEITSNFIMTTFETSQDLPIKSQDPNSLNDYVQSRGYSSYVAEVNREAYEALKKSNDNMLIVTGSLYLLGQI